ncbi:Antirestriction protein [hydrothermal vent metagenome]|uniref:Antirestriction protein n=1 Tax=hydrothermal vent metagenome TaxID=652676 RepID=A0A3B1BHI4_9ZZZZ
MTRYFRVFNSDQVDGEHARIAEQKFKDKLLDHNPILEAEHFVKNYTINERLNRDLSGRFGDQAYSFEELVAELGSAMICGSLGLEQQPRIDHARYIKGWLSNLRGDSKFIISAASHAQKAADYALQSAEQQEGKKHGTAHLKI